MSQTEEYHSATEEEYENDIRIVKPDKIQIKTSSIRTVFDNYLKKSK